MLCSDSLAGQLEVEPALGWLGDHAWALSGLSILLFLLGVAAAAAVAILIPEDYFAGRVPADRSVWNGTAMHIFRRLAKNVAGVIVLAAGVVMLVTPGPGLVLILLGVSLMDFPGKRALERRIVRNPVVLSRINRMRVRFGRPPLTVD